MVLMLPIKWKRRITKLQDGSSSITSDTIRVNSIPKMAVTLAMNASIVKTN